jgi:hypothetical protein
VLMRWLACSLARPESRPADHYPGQFSIAIRILGAPKAESELLAAVSGAWGVRVQIIWASGVDL